MTHLAAVALAAAALGAPLPAAADSARPTNYRSEVTSIEPPNGGVSADVVGGDAFLRIEAAPGVTVEVPGYEGEPYVRIGADGTVEVNRNSPSYWVNEDRFGARAVPPEASVDADPAWLTVGADGTYGWHDHRIHWMSPDPPPVVESSSVSEIFEWVVPVSVDGDPVEIHGQLEWVPSIDPIPWLALSAVAVAVAFVRPLTALLVGAVAAIVVGVAQVAGSPLGPVDESMTWIPPSVALGLVVWAAFREHRHLTIGVGAVVVLAWAVSRFPALWMPSLPSSLPAGLERTATAVAAGVGLGGLVVAYRDLQKGAGG